MSRNEKNGITLKPIHIVIGVVAAVIVITAAVLFGLQQRPTQAESGFTPDLQEGTSAWSGDTLPDKTPESSGEAVGIKIPGNPSISMPANQQDVEVALLFRTMVFSTLCMVRTATRQLRCTLIKSSPKCCSSSSMVIR